MRHLFAVISLLLILNSAHSQKKPYVIYNAKGKKVKYKKMLKKLKDKDIILFGEHHDNPISYWLQYELTSDLHQVRELVLGAEMFEADNQIHLTNYVNSKIDFKAFDSLARLWSNYKTDYSPLVEFAKENQLQFVATNIPRRYANMVYKQDFESLNTLSAEEKSWIAPLPIPFDPELPTYKNILEMMGDHGSPLLVKAQAIKDATMAHFILHNYKTGYLFIHYNGAYHSDFYEGILWYLKQENTNLNYATISTVTQADVNSLEEEHKRKADFIICVDDNMTKTY
jgi:uncharacterized iron-regulated protein